MKQKTRDFEKKINTQNMAKIVLTPFLLGFSSLDLNHSETM